MTASILPSAYVSPECPNNKLINELHSDLMGGLGIEGTKITKV
jgi:hypothetical protein